VVLAKSGRQSTQKGGTSVPEAKEQTIRMPYNDFVLEIYDVANQITYISEQAQED
jgi:hypothetical protein